MKPFLTIEFQRSGRIYQVQTEAVVADWVSEQTILNPGRTPEQYAFEARQLFADDFAMVTWIRESMTWADLFPYAVLVGQRPFDLAAEFEDAVLATADQQKHVESIADEDLMESPIGLYVSMMAKENENCRVNVLTSGEEQKPVAGIILIRGEVQIINGFIGVVSQFDDMLRTASALKAMEEAESQAKH